MRQLGTPADTWERAGVGPERLSCFNDVWAGESAFDVVFMRTIIWVTLWPLPRLASSVPTSSVILMALGVGSAPCRVPAPRHAHGCFVFLCFTVVHECDLDSTPSILGAQQPRVGAHSLAAHVSSSLYRPWTEGRSCSPTLQGSGSHTDTRPRLYPKMGRRRGHTWPAFDKQPLVGAGLNCLESPRGQCRVRHSLQRASSPCPKGARKQPPESQRGLTAGAGNRQRRYVAHLRSQRPHSNVGSKRVTPHPHCLW